MYKKSVIFLFINFFLLQITGYSQAVSGKMTPEKFVNRVLLYSNEAKLIDVEKQIATKIKDLSRVKLAVPSLELKLYPFGYDDRRTNTFISRYGYNPTGTTNPLVFSGVEQLGIDRAYYTSGAELSLETLTPFGGFFGFNVSEFFLINTNNVNGIPEEYRQKIKFDFVLSQPLFINNVLADLRPFFNEFKIIRQKETIAEFERLEKENKLIIGAYKQAYSIITLQKQKSLLEKTVTVLSKDVEAMKIRLRDGLVSKKTSNSLELTFLQTKEQLNDLLTQYQTLRLRAAQMASVSDETLVLQEQAGVQKKIERVATKIIKKDDLARNYEVKQKELEYDIANKALYSKDIESRPSMNLNFSLQPRYPESRTNVDNFATSFSDFSAAGSKLDYLFTVEFAFPLLTGFERQHRRSLDILSVQARRYAYEKELNDKWILLQELQNKQNNFKQKIQAVNLDVSLKKSFVATKKAQLKQGTTSVQELRRQELQLLEAQNKQWTIITDKIINDLNILNSRGYRLKDLL